MSFIAVIDYGMGNLRSVAKALEHVTAGKRRILITKEPEQVRAAERVVFPGQGAAGDCMRELARNGLDEAVREAARSKPFLGLCMGMQALLDVSEENGGTACLGLLPGEVRAFGGAFDEVDGAQHLKIPHMGWNQVAQVRAHPLWQGITDGSRFYFVHSYYVVPADAALMLGTTEYGVSFTSAMGRDNVFAMQCHPEKSSAAGLTLLANFTRWDGAA
jgi:imidazole glycerol-phosphate synthase subunit HisH